MRWFHHYKGARRAASSSGLEASPARPFEVRGGGPSLWYSWRRLNRYPGFVLAVDRAAALERHLADDAAQDRGGSGRVRGGRDTSEMGALVSLDGHPVVRLLFVPVVRQISPLGVAQVGVAASEASGGSSEGLPDVCWRVPVRLRQFLRLREHRCGLRGGRRLRVPLSALHVQQASVSFVSSPPLASGFGSLTESRDLAR
eukprot:scaffold8377_cov353-Pinguiococcus_pyrenoidosus.AAC.1